MCSDVLSLDFTLLLHMGHGGGVSLRVFHFFFKPKNFVLQKESRRLSGFLHGDVFPAGTEVGGLHAALFEHLHAFEKQRALASPLR